MRFDVKDVRTLTNERGSLMTVLRSELSVGR